MQINAFKLFKLVKFNNSIKFHSKTATRLTFTNFFFVAFFLLFKRTFVMTAIVTGPRTLTTFLTPTILIIVIIIWVLVNTGYTISVKFSVTNTRVFIAKTAHKQNLLNFITKKVMYIGVILIVFKLNNFCAFD